MSSRGMPSTWLRSLCTRYAVRGQSVSEQQGDDGERSGSPKDEHPSHHLGLEFREALTKLRVEAREVQLIDFSKKQRFPFPLSRFP